MGCLNLWTYWEKALTSLVQWLRRWLHALVKKISLSSPLTMALLPPVFSATSSLMDLNYLYRFPDIVWCKEKVYCQIFVYSIRNVQWRRSCERLTGFTLSSHCVLIEVTLSSHCSPCTFRVRIWLDLQQVPLCWSKYIYAFKNTQLALLKPLRVACRW